MRIFPQTLLIKRLKGKLPPRYGRACDWLNPLSTDDVLEKLRRLAGQDFGYDVDAWQARWKRELPRHL